MSWLKRKLTTWYFRRELNPRRRRQRQQQAEKRIAQSGVREVHYFHQADDPYSHLAAQLLPQLLARYEIELVPHLVGSPDGIYAPEEQRLQIWSRTDAALLAPAYGLQYADAGAQPEAELCALAQGILARLTENPTGFAEHAGAVSDALWRGDADALRALNEQCGNADAEAVQATIQASNAAREKLGHYLGATFCYAGTWYWGVDRLHYLEQRLLDADAGRAAADSGQAAANAGQTTAGAGGVAADTGQAASVPADSEHATAGAGQIANSEQAPASARQTTASALLAAPPQHRAATGSGANCKLEFFPSLRSPYTAIVFERLSEFCARTQVELVTRPVLPMVMRNLPVPPTKGRYIMQDTLRESERTGAAFGNVCDPVGEPVQRTYSLFPWAETQGKGYELLFHAARAAWSEAVDLGTDQGLRLAVERAGLNWDAAPQPLQDDSWKEMCEASQQELLRLNLWGVPSFHLTGNGIDVAVWGQDRLWVLEQALAK